jgi:hypothetical protein
MPNLLKQLELEELSLVDRPANAQAMVSLFKRDNSEGEVHKMTDGQKEEMDKMSEDMKSKMKMYMEEKGMSYDKAKAMCENDMKKSDETVEEVAAEPSELDLLKRENERLRKSLIENGFVIKAEAIEKKAEVETIEVEGEMVAKSDIPTPVLKALEALAIEKADMELTKRAEATLPHFDTKVAKELLKFDLGEEAMAALKAADKLFEGTMAEFGKSDADGNFASANDKIDALVKNYMEEHKLKKSQYAIAYAAVAKTDEGKALIAKSYKGE